MLVVIETHPVPYHAAVYRAVEQRFGIPVTVIYESDFSISGYRDNGFGVTLSWDTDLITGYASIFLSSRGGAAQERKKDISARSLKKELIRLKPKAALLIGYSPVFYQIAFYRALREKIPIIFRAETTDYRQREFFLKKLFRESILRWLYTRCEKVLFIGKNSLEHYKRLGCPDAKLIFSPYCVDTGCFDTDEKSHNFLRRQVRASLGIADSGIVLIFSGKLIRRKRPDMILEAIRILPAGYRKKIVLLFLGDGRLRESLKRLAGKEPAVRTVFLGFENQTKLSRYYHAADLFVFPSSYEPWGLVINEALVHGLPCVVSRGVNCVPDLINPGVTGEICEIASSQSLAAAIIRAFLLVGREDVREQCRKKISGYTVQKAAEGIARAYREIVF